MSSSYSFAHHKSVYQFFFSFYFHCFPAFLSLLTSPPTFLLSSSPFSLLLSFPLFSSSFLQSYLLPPFRRSLPPTTPSHHPLLPLPPFYYSFLPNLLLQSLPLRLPAYPSAFILPWTLHFFCFSPCHHPLLSFQTTSTRL